ncbi:YncE family protein [Roseomonas sp. GC11]|uniref:YncE family protein n=1 Tax=Roseomonas sp. GC11 TaxID=2950546 RepID=UPI00210A1701|nr:YncE family protein [Roseomonas sp. GC11]MCQ4160070.1 YncE family protein [Roseomonas sp. GC11]
MRLSRRQALSLLPGLALAPRAAGAQGGTTPAASPAGDLVFVLNSGEANILVLDAATREEKRRIPVLREVHHLVMTPDGSTLLVGDSGANEMLFLNPLTGELIKREPLSNPYHLGFSPDGRFLCITSLRRDQVDIYAWDGSALTLVKRHSLPDMPSHLAFRPDGKVVYVTLQGNNLLAAISLEGNFDHLWSMEIGPEPAGVMWNRGKLLVGIMGSDYIAVADPETQAVERRIVTARGAHALFWNLKGDTIYATSRVDSRITTIDPETLTVTRSLKVPGGPDDISFDPQGRLWVTQRWIAKVAVVDFEAGKVESIRAGRSPHGIFYASAQALRAPATN